MVTWGWYYLSYLRHYCNRNCDPCDGYHCIEVTYRILWALQKMYILIRVSQASQSQLSLFGLYTWRSPGQQRGSPANTERILRVRSQQHVGTRRMSQCLSIPGLEKHAKSTMTRIFQLFCLSRQSPKNISKKSPKQKSELRKISFLQNKVVFHRQILSRFLPTFHPIACLNWFWRKLDPFC